MDDDWQDLYFPPPGRRRYRAPTYPRLTARPPAPAPRWEPVTEAPVPPAPPGGTDTEPDDARPAATDQTETAAAGTSPAPELPELAPIAVGPPIHAFEPRPGIAVPYRSDTVVDGWSTDRFTVRAASIRGYGHRWDRLPRQDDLAVGVHEETGVLLAVVADGVSSCPLSHLGSTAACRHTLETARGQLDTLGRIDWPELVAGAAWSLVHLAESGVAGPTDDPVATAASTFACTLAVVALWPTALGVVAECVTVGDSSVWTVRSGTWEVRSGAKVSTGGVSSGLTAALPRVPTPVTATQFALDDDAVLVLGTDGLGDAVGEGHGTVAGLFATLLTAPPPPLRLAHALDFSLDTFDDDRTMVAVWPRSVAAAAGRRVRPGAAG